MVAVDHRENRAGDQREEGAFERERERNVYIYIEREREIERERYVLCIVCIYNV